MLNINKALIFYNLYKPITLLNVFVSLITINFTVTSLKLSKDKALPCLYKQYRDATHTKIYATDTKLYITYTKNYRTDKALPCLYKQYRDATHTKLYATYTKIYATYTKNYQIYTKFTAETRQCLVSTNCWLSNDYISLQQLNTFYL